MEPEDLSPAASLYRAFERPALIVLTVLQMLMGIGLALAIILKIYMFIFTAQSCTDDGTSLGNIVRCTSFLVILAQTLMAVAAFQFAAHMFTPKPVLNLGTLSMGLAGALLVLVSGVTAEAATWQLSLLITAVFATVGGTYLAHRYLSKPDNID